MVHLACSLELPVAERCALDALLQDCGPITTTRQRPAQRSLVLGGGGTITTFLPYLVLLFFGAGSAIAFKSFWEAIGSETGKQLVKWFLRPEGNSEEPKREGKNCTIYGAPIALLFEPRDSVFAAVPVLDPGEPGFNKRATVPQLIEGAAQKLRPGIPDLLLVSYDQDSKLWVVNRRQGPFILVYHS